MIAVLVERDIEIKYPRLMQLKTNGNLIVYFIREGEGVILKASSNSNPVGSLNKNYTMDLFEDFKGSITLTQK